MGNNILFILVALVLLGISGCTEQTPLTKVVVQNASFILDGKSISATEFADRYNSLSKDYSSLKSSCESNISELKSETRECNGFLSNFRYWFLEKFNTFNMDSDYDYRFRRLGTSIEIDYDNDATIYDSKVLCGTDSMRPTIDCNDYIWGYKPESPEYIKEGDIIAFRLNPSAKSNIVHRVILIEEVNGEHLYYTSGDNKLNQMSNDKVLVTDATPIRFDQIEFKVAGVAYG